MNPYDDILVRLAASAPWEARSINGPHHDTADWLGSGAGFPLPVKRLADHVGKTSGRRGGVRETSGSWSHFKLSKGQAGGASDAEANRWTSASLSDPANVSRPLAPVTLEKLAKAAHAQGDTPDCRKNRIARHVAPSSGKAVSQTGLAALAALRRLAGEQHADEAAHALRAPAAPVSGGLSALKSLRDAARAELQAPQAARAASRRLNRADNPTHTGDGSPHGHAASLANIASVACGSNIASNAAALPESKHDADEKRPLARQRLSVVSVGDPFAAHLLRACLLASAFAKRPLAGLEEIAPAEDLEECAGAVYLSHALCPADGWAIDPHADAAAEIEAVASASLSAFEGALAPASPEAAPGARAQQAFVLLDFTGSSWLGDALPFAFAEALRKGRCVVVLAESTQTSLWDRLIASIRSVCATEKDGLEDAEDRALNLFSVDEGDPGRARDLNRFLHAWWAWFGSGSRWGFFELSAALERSLGVLGFNLHQQSCDLGLVSLIAALLRDGGSIASADDVAEALADRLPNHDLLQLAVDATMETLLGECPKERPSTSDGRVFIPLQPFCEWVDKRAGRHASFEMLAALHSSPSLKTLLSIGECPQPDAKEGSLPPADGPCIEVRFSSLFACLAARWLMGDPPRMAREVAACLEALAQRVPAGGWGRIVLQTTLLAEQRRQTYVSSLVLERLYASMADDRAMRNMLVEISLGLLPDTGGALPSIWRDVFFNGSINHNQAHLLAEARESSWLRRENLLMLQHATAALAVRAQTGALRDDDPPQAENVCAWMDALLQAAEASCAHDLFDQVAADLLSGDPPRRRAAFGRYDCLIWACLFGVDLPCPTWRADALREGPLLAVAREAADELTGNGPAYAECARFAWLYATECPHLWSTETWQRVGKTASDIVRGARRPADARQQDSAHEVLAAYALRMDARRADPLPPLSVCEGRASQAGASLERLAPAGFPPSSSDKTADQGRRLYAAMARVALGTAAPEEARTFVCETIDRTGLGSVATYQLKLFLAASNDAGADGGLASVAWPSARTQQHSLDSDALRALAKRWEACLDRMRMQHR